MDEMIALQGEWEKSTDAKIRAMSWMEFRQKHKACARCGEVWPLDLEPGKCHDRDCPELGANPLDRQEMMMPTDKERTEALLHCFGLPTERDLEAGMDNSKPSACGHAPELSSDDVRPGDYDGAIYVARQAETERDALRSRNTELVEALRGMVSWYSLSRQQGDMPPAVDRARSILAKAPA